MTEHESMRRKVWVAQSSADTATAVLAAFDAAFPVDPDLNAKFGPELARVTPRYKTRSLSDGLLCGHGFRGGIGCTKCLGLANYQKGE